MSPQRYQRLSRKYHSHHNYHSSSKFFTGGSRPLTGRKSIADNWSPQLFPRYLFINQSICVQRFLLRMSVLVVLEKKSVFFLLLFSYDKHFLWHRCGMRGTQRTLTTIRKPTGPLLKKSPNVNLPCLRTSEQELETFFGSKTKEKRDLLFIVWRPPCSIQPIFGDCSDWWWGQCWPQCCLCYEKPYNQNIFDIANLFEYSEYLRYAEKPYYRSKSFIVQRWVDTSHLFAPTCTGCDPIWTK